MMRAWKSRSAPAQRGVRKQILARLPCFEVCQVKGRRRRRHRTTAQEHLPDHAFTKTPSSRQSKAQAEERRRARTSAFRKKTSCWACSPPRVGTSGAESQGVFRRGGSAEGLRARLVYRSFCLNSSRFAVSEVASRKGRRAQALREGIPDAPPLPLGSGTPEQVALGRATDVGSSRMWCLRMWGLKIIRY